MKSPNKIYVTFFQLILNKKTNIKSIYNGDNKWII